MDQWSNRSIGASKQKNPKAFEEQHFDFTTDALSPAEVAESPVRGVSHDDVDLVRLYLRNFGERKFLTTSEQEEI